MKFIKHFSLDCICTHWGSGKNNNFQKNVRFKNIPVQNVIYSCFINYVLYRIFLKNFKRNWPLQKHLLYFAFSFSTHFLSMQNWKANDSSGNIIFFSLGPFLKSNFSLRDETNQVMSSQVKLWKIRNGCNLTRPNIKAWVAAQSNLQLQVPAIGYLDFVS